MQCLADPCLVPIERPAAPTHEVMERGWTVDHGQDVHRFVGGESIPQWPYCDRSLHD